MLKLLELIKLLKSAKFREIDHATWDGESVDVESHDIDFLIGEGRVTIEAKLKKSGKSHAIKAVHALDDSSNDITIDGENVDKDDVDLDLDTHFGWSALEYRLEYTQSGNPHEIVLTAKVTWI